MSKELSAAASEEFDKEVLHAAQSDETGGLAGTVTQRTGVVGDTYHFRVMGKGMANQKPSQADVTPMDVAHDKVPCTLANWNAPEYTDIFDAAEVNFDEQKELAYTCAMAIRRRKDQLIIDALDAATGLAGTVGNDIGGTNSDMNPDKARRAAKYLNAQGLPNSDRHILVSATGLESMLGNTEATSSDYNTVKTLVNGDMKEQQFIGFQWHVIEERDEGGLPLSTTDRKSFAYHKPGVGLAIGIDMKSEVNYIAQKTSWLANCIFKGGAVVRDSLRVVEIATVEDIT